MVVAANCLLGLLSEFLSTIRRFDDSFIEPILFECRLLKSFFLVMSCRTVCDSLCAAPAKLVVSGGNCCARGGLNELNAEAS